LQNLGGNEGAQRRSGTRSLAQPRAEPLPSRVTETDVAAHRSFIDKLAEKAIWLRFWGPASP
jgi:DNA polymerase-3 subunit epsilon